MIPTNILNSISSNVSNQTSKITKNFGYVYDVILDDEHEYIKNSNGSHGSDYIGCVLIKYGSDLVANASSLTIAYPFNKNFNTLPTINEMVEIFMGAGGIPLYKRLDLGITPNVNTYEDQISDTNLTNTGPDTKSYSNIINTGIVNGNTNDISKYSKFGKYFIPTKIYRLKLYEGDSIIESRFGQSIRFTAYNNQSQSFSPTIIIRNRQNDFNSDADILKSFEEDVNTDGSVIVMSSNDYELPFIPGNVNKKGVGDFKTKPSSFDNYPTKLSGDQLLLNSGRVIISSKTSEMIFYSKKNYGFISDGSMSIDNAGGIDVGVGSDINFITNDNNFSIFSGNGSIFLGDNDLEPIPKGQQLVNILSELIDAIVEQQYLTPSGPTKIGPENVPTFASIKSKLNSILSKLNQTA